MVDQDLYLAIGDLERQMAMKEVSDTGMRSSDWERSDNRNPQPAIRKEQGQAVALFAVVIPVTVLFALGVVDYMITNARVMETVAAADLAAHAGAQRITMLPDGTIESLPFQAQAVASSYFAAQALPEANLESVSCGLIQDRPACQVSAQVRSSGWLLPKQWISVHAVGYLVYGVTEGDQ